MKRRRHPSTTTRLLATLVGTLFVFMMISAQVPYCQCGIFCRHDAQKAEATEVETLQGCCSSEKKHQASLPDPAQELPCSTDGECPCSVEMTSSQDVFAVMMHFVSSSSDHHPGAVIVADTVPLTLSETILAETPQWRPTRGSPLARQSLHVLNSVYII